MPVERRGLGSRTTLTRRGRGEWHEPGASRKSPEAVPTPLPRWDPWPASLVLGQRLRPSPGNRRVGSHVTFFEACSAFTLVSACMFAKSPKATLYTGGSDGFVSSTTAPIATGRSDQLPGGIRTHWKAPPLHGARLPEG